VLRDKAVQYISAHLLHFENIHTNLCSKSINVYEKE